jgi:hypothetical protein
MRRSYDVESGFLYNFVEYQILKLVDSYYFCTFYVHFPKFEKYLEMKLSTKLWHSLKF